MPLSAASLRRLSVGSTPALSTNTSGDVAVESLSVSPRSSTGGSTYLRPRALETYVVAAKMTRSGRRQRTRMRRCSSLHLDSHSAGSSEASGSPRRYQVSHSLRLDSKEEMTPCAGCGDVCEV